MSRAGEAAVATGIAIVIVLGVRAVRGGKGSGDFDAPSSSAADSSNRYPDAGVSFRQPPVVVPLDPGALTGDTASEDFHTFMHRCGGCHRAPAPSMHRAEGWPPVVQRMEVHIQQAGLLPLSDTSRDEIADFLARHADTTRIGAASN